ncbi:MAG TPA: DedA family protein [Chloroflexota bacterium]|nr:DedA family protein [Chloroflexota bacterium]
MHGLEDAIVAIVTSAYGSIGYVGVLVLMAIESCNIPIPSEVILPLAGFLVGQHTFSFWPAVLAGAVGGTLGSAVSYWIGALGGRPLMLKYGRYVLISASDAARADKFFERYGDATAFFSRLLPVIRTFISLPAGITRMNFAKFLTYTFAGSLLWSIVLVYVGEVLGQNWLEVRNVLQRFDYAIAALIVAAVALYIYRHLAHAQRAAP